jgi:hypothetical protein
MNQIGHVPNEIRDPGVVWLPLPDALDHFLQGSLGICHFG